jgi:hypothetical protein
MSPTDPIVRLRELQAPDEDAAAERAWLRVQETLAAEPAAAEQPSRRASRPARLRSPALGMAVLALAVVVAAAALTPPGEAVADWLRNAVVRPSPRHAEPAVRPLRLPAGGALLARTPAGLSILAADGARRRLGRWDDAAWSPSGRFVAVVRGSRLAALDRHGRVRWSLTRPYRLAQPAWAPDGFHVAYRSANGLRVVAGDGTGDRFLAGRLGPAGSAWRPAPGAVVAWADQRGRVRTGDAMTGRLSWAGAPGPAVRFLRWSADGSRLAAVSSRSLRVYDAGGRLVRRLRIPRGQVVEAAAAARRGATLALALYDARRGYSQVATVPLRRGHAPQPLFGGRGRVADLTFSPPGGWLLVGWRGADQWMFLRAPGAERAVSVAGVTKQLDATAYPRVLGWCCPP